MGLVVGDRLVLYATAVPAGYCLRKWSAFTPPPEAMFPPRRIAIRPFPVPAARRSQSPKDWGKAGSLSTPFLMR